MRTQDNLIVVPFDPKDYADYRAAMVAPITREYLESDYYDELMETFLNKGSDRFHLADTPRTESFMFRHTHMRHVNAWKWLCNHQHKDFLRYRLYI